MGSYRRGPEIISGLAIKQQNSFSCTWEFTNHELSVLPGTYEIAVKVVALNDAADFNLDECHFQNNTFFQNGTILQNYIPPFNFYAHKTTCCEMCTRHENCTHFVAFRKESLPIRCILYSSVTGGLHNIPEHNNQVSTVAGVSRSKQQGSTV